MTIIMNDILNVNVNVSTLMTIRNICKRWLMNKNRQMLPTSYNTSEHQPNPNTSSVKIRWKLKLAAFSRNLLAGLTFAYHLHPNILSHSYYVFCPPDSRTNCRESQFAMSKLHPRCPRYHLLLLICLLVFDDLKCVSNQHCIIAWWRQAVGWKKNQSTIG